MILFLVKNKIRKQGYGLARKGHGNTVNNVHWTPYTVLYLIIFHLGNVLPLLIICILLNRVAAPPLPICIDDRIERIHELLSS